MTSRSRRRWCAVGVSMVLAYATSGFVPSIVAAQVVGGSIGGTITDGTGGALPGVTVTVTNKANGTNQVLTASLSRTPAGDPRQIQWGVRYAF